MDLLEKMATYVRVIEAGSFTAAAKQLRVSSAAVSRQIATLEADLRATLLLRSTRRMTVTTVGRAYYERCVRVLREVEDAQAIGKGKAPEGILVVTAPVTFGLGRIVPCLGSLMRAHPGLRIDLRLEDRLLDLALEGVDVAIRVGSAPPERTDLVAHGLGSFQRVLVASAEYLKRRGEPKTPETLAKHDSLAHAAGPSADTWTLRSDERVARIRPNVTFRTNALHALAELARNGVGIALLPDWLVAADLKTRALRPVLPGWKTEAVPINAIHRTEQRGTPRVRVFVDHLREAYGAPPRAGAWRTS